MTTKATKEASDLERLKFNLEQALDNGVDFKNRTIRITGTIGAPNPMDAGSEYFDFNLLDYALTELEAQSSNPVTIKINSPGGEVYEALAMIGRIKSSNCEIITEGFGAVMSAATLILMAGDIRKMSKYCVPMYHEISYGVGGDHESIKEQVAQSEKELKRWASYYEEFSNKNRAFWLSKMKKKEFYPTPEQMLEYGAIDEVI